MSKGKWNLIQRKKRFDFIFIKLPKKFADFFSRINDKDPQFCFVCGFYIPIFLRNTDEIKKPTKNSEPCHTRCFNLNVKFDHIHGKLNEDSELICLIDNGNSLSKQPVCRMRVRNNKNSMLHHIKQKHPEFAEEFSKIDTKDDYNIFRKEMFLKPDGRKFSK